MQSNNNAKHWRERAEMARVLEQEMNSEASIRAMKNLTADYEARARRIEEMGKITLAAEDSN